MRLGFISDLHWMSRRPPAPAAWHNEGEFDGVLERLAAALSHFADRGVDRIVLGGDLAHHGDVDSLEQVLRACADASAPIIVVSGNHDVADDIGRVERAHERAAVGRVALANPDGILADGLRIAGVHVGETDRWFGASLRAHPDTVGWGSEPAVLLSHYPVLSLATLVSDHGFPYPGDLLDRAELADPLIARDAPTVVLSGHVHTRATLSSGSVLQLSAGALIEPPYDCSVIEINDSFGVLDVHRDSIRLREDGAAREPVFAPEREQWRFEDGAWISVGESAGAASRGAERVTQGAAVAQGAAAAQGAGQP